MGADNFMAYVGIRILLDPKNERELEGIETRSDSRIAAARDAGLQSYLGRWTDGEYHFLLIGTELGRFGAEGRDYAGFKSEELSSIVAKTRERLIHAGFKGEPSIHLQFEAQD
ncbi:MAG TPA: hypothetical protein VMU54_08640 [Planctomycetota bacterium]|nr:hypothetical protein [Planctomycetota bacterium]